MTNTDPRHATERQTDQTLWERLFGGHSPRDEVEWCPVMSAERIAQNAWRNLEDTSDLDRDEVIGSLARTLRYEGGAK